MAGPTSSATLRRACVLLAALAGSLAPSVALAGTASASTPSATALIATVIANMRTVPVIQFSGTETGMKVHGFYVAHPQSSQLSLSGTVMGATIEVSMVEIGKKNWMKANEAGWELFTLGLAPRSTLAQLSPTTWYVSSGTTTVDFGNSLCPTTSSTSSRCLLRGTKLVSYSRSKAVISATSPKETIRLTSIRGKFLPTSIVAFGATRVTENLSYLARSPKVAAPAGAKPFPSRH
ncbi:MAG: hypothetical protein ACRDXC_01980 [Acidimicrobiales bacterium]